MSALNYPGFVTLLDQAAVIVSDSGGVQEEAPSFGVPVLITRDITERPEVLQCGGTLVGTSPHKLRAALQQALKLKKLKREFIRTPFGDGQASPRIVEQILKDLHRRKSPAHFVKFTRSLPRLLTPTGRIHPNTRPNTRPSAPPVTWSQVKTNLKIN